MFTNCDTWRPHLTIALNLTVTVRIETSQVSIKTCCTYSSDYIHTSENMKNNPNFCVLFLLVQNIQLK